MIKRFNYYDLVISVKKGREILIWTIFLKNISTVQPSSIPNRFSWRNTQYLLSKKKSFCRNQKQSVPTNFHLTAFFCHQKQTNKKQCYSPCNHTVSLKMNFVQRNDKEIKTNIKFFFFQQNKGICIKLGKQNINLIQLSK